MCVSAVFPAKTDNYRANTDFPLIMCLLYTQNKQTSPYVQFWICASLESKGTISLVVNRNVQKARKFWIINCKGKGSFYLLIPYDFRTESLWSQNDKIKFAMETLCVRILQMLKIKYQQIQRGLLRRVTECGLLCGLQQALVCSGPNAQYDLRNSSKRGPLWTKGQQGKVQCLNFLPLLKRMKGHRRLQNGLFSRKQILSYKHLEQQKCKPEKEALFIRKEQTDWSGFRFQLFVCSSGTGNPGALWGSWDLEIAERGCRPVPSPVPPPLGEEAMVPSWLIVQAT